jgi:putative DNA primase/helicase
LKRKLLDELPGIFNWALEGLPRLEQRGLFAIPEVCKVESQQVRDENDTEAAFVAAWCDRDSSTKSSDLYLAYKTWCKRNGFSPKSSTSVARDWRRLGFRKVKERDGHYWAGVSLSLEAAKAIGFEREEVA